MGFKKESNKIGKKITETSVIRISLLPNAHNEEPQKRIF